MIDGIALRYAQTWLENPPLISILTFPFQCFTEEFPATFDYQRLLVLSLSVTFHIGVPLCIYPLTIKYGNGQSIDDAHVEGISRCHV